jgi:hypothetical protein
LYRCDEDAVPFTTLNVNLAITKPASATTNIVAGRCRLNHPGSSPRLGFNACKLKYDDPLSKRRVQFRLKYVAFNFAQKKCLLRIIVFLPCRRPYIGGKDGPLGITAGEPLEVEGFAFSGGGNAAGAVHVEDHPEIDSAWLQHYLVM